MSNKQTSLEENIKSLCSLLWGQSSDAIHTHIKALPTFEVMQETSAGLELLQAIQGLMFNVQEQKYKVLLVHLANNNFIYSSKTRKSQWQTTMNNLQHPQSA